MSVTELAVEKIKSLSEDRTKDALAYLEKLEHEQAEEDRLDIEAARASLAETGDNIPLEKLARELGL